jgi:hypothetical protein
MRPEVAALVQDTWTQDVVNNEVAFRAAMNKVSSAFLTCRRNDDIVTANNWMGCLMEARRFSAECPYASIYAHNLAFVSATMADWLACQHKYGDAVDIAARAWETLDSRDARRSALGLPALPSIESRWRLLGVLADVKWRMPDEQYKDVVLTPGQHVQAWLRYAQRLHENLGAEPSEELTPQQRITRLQVDKTKTESLLWAGLWTACCAFRYCKMELVRLVREFNILHRRHYRCAGLAMAERHWLEDAPLAPESPLYWHFEIAKQWISEQKQAKGGPRRSSFTIDELEELYSQLLLSIEIWTEARPDKVYTAGLERDYRWMREEILNRGEVKVDPLALDNDAEGDDSSLLEAMPAAVTSAQ